MTTKPNPKDYMFTDLKGETLVKNPGQIHGFQFKVRNLEDCVVHLLDHSAAVYVDNCKNTTFVIGPIKGPVYVRNCDNCVVHVACQQFRCRDISNTTIYLFSQNDPVIEASTDLKFAPFNIAYPKLAEHVAAAGLNAEVNKWELIFDFSKKGEQNFQMLPPEEFAVQFIPVEGMGEPELVLGIPQRYGGNLPDTPPESSAENNAFGIKTTQAAAQNVYEQQTQEYQSADLMNSSEQNNQSIPNMQSQNASSSNDGSNFGMPSMQNQNQFGTFQNTGDSFAAFNTNAGAGPIEGDYNEEELELIRNAEMKKQTRLGEVHQFQMSEQKLKDERRMKGRLALEEWEAERTKQIALRKQNNIQNETSAQAEEEEMKANPNKWIRVCSTCDFTKSVTASGKDLSRMRDVMLARKQDMVNGGENNQFF